MTVAEIVVGTLPPAQAALPALTAGAVRTVGLVLLAAVVAAAAAVLYRWYAHGRVPEGVPVLAGLAAVAIYLNTTTALGQVMGGRTGLLDPDDALLNTLTFVLAAGASIVGQRAGDRFARAIGVVGGRRELDADLSRLVQSVGRVIAVSLPDSPGDIEDIDGYDPVPSETKAALAGTTLLFPRGLTVAALRERLVERLRDDYRVGHVDVDLSEDGSIEFLAVGSRAAGIGPTLAPGTAATAVRADPPYSATAGDVVQLWTGGDAPERAATAELRAAAGDVVTLALDEEDAVAVEADRPYRLVTLPSEPRADREFASLLRGADETMATVAVAEGGALEGATVGSLDVTVVAIRPADGTVEAIPRRNRTLEAGDELYAIARPERLRRLGAAEPGEGPTVAEGEND